MIGGKTAFVPTLFMVNRETCTLHSFHRWVKRQLLCAKLHHPAWNAVAFQGILITLPLLACAGLFAAGLLYGNISLIVWNLGSFAAYWGGVFGTLPIMENNIRQLLKQRGEPVNAWGIKRTFLTLLMIPVTQIVYTSALVQLYFLRHVEWRGVEYEIGTKKQVRLIEYKPYKNDRLTENNSLSI
jgi:hypothetical protein